MRPSAKRAFSLLFSVILLVAALFIYGLFIQPEYEDLAVLRGRLSGQKDLFQDKQQAIAKVESLIKQYQGAGRLQDTISMSLPPREELAAVFNQLQGIAAFNGLGIEVFNVQPLPIKPGRERSLVRGLGTLRLSLRLLGPYENFRGFLRGLETNIRLMDVVSLKIEPFDSAQGKASGGLVYNLVVDSYYQTR